MVRSRNGITIRYLDHASHAQNSTVFRPSMTGPSPKSYCNHNPGSVTHGRCTRAFPNRYCFLTCATARRDDRSDPVNPIASNLSWATSARIFPLDCSTHSSIFGRNSSTNRGRLVRGAVPPASRSATSRATVWCEHPARSAAACNEPRRSNAARISMDSSADFKWSLLGARRARQHRQADFRRDPNRGTRPGWTRGVSETTHTQVGSFVATSGAETVAINGLFRDRLWAVFHGRGQRFRADA